MPSQYADPYMNQVLWDMFDFGPNVAFTQEHAGQYGAANAAGSFEAGLVQEYSNLPWFDPTTAQSQNASQNEYYGNIADPGESPYIFFQDPQLRQGTYDMTGFGWKAFDMGAWMRDYGMYLPTLQPEDIDAIRRKSKSDYDKSIYNILEDANLSKIALSSGVFNTNEDWRKLQDVLLSTGRLSRFKGQQSEESLLNQYNQDLYSAVGMLADVGAFETYEEGYAPGSGSTESGSGSGIEGSYSGYADAEYGNWDVMYEYDVGSNFCSAMCGTGESSYFPEGEGESAGSNCYNNCMQMQMSLIEDYDPGDGSVLAGTGID